MNRPAVARTLPEDLPPASASKREAIVSAAAKVFLEQGYGAASMDQIAGQAGVSKQTIYSHFGAKDALFEEIVRGKCAQLMSADGVQVQDGSPKAVLSDTAAQFLRVILSDESTALFRMIIAESARFPELAQAFYRAGPGAATKRLAAYLTDTNDKGLLKAGDPTVAAQMFFAMLRGDIYVQRIILLRGAPDEAEVKREAERVATLFLRLYGQP